MDGDPGAGGGGIAAPVAHAGGRFVGLLLDWGFPIAAFLIGWGMKDPFQLEGIIKGFLPPMLQDPTALGWLSGILGSLAYFALAFLAMRFVPWLGRTLGALFAGMGLNLLLHAIRTKRTEGIVPLPPGSPVR